MKELYVLLGCGYHARGVASVLSELKPEALIVFVDDNAQPNETILGYPVLKSVPLGVCHYVLATGDNKKRRKWSAGRNTETVIAQDAAVGRMAKIGSGSFIGSGAFVGSEAVIGEGGIVNTHAVVEHNCKVAQYCNICPGAILLGQCVVGANSFIGAGAVVKNNVHICENVVVGMGAVVLSDINEPGTYAGNPARRISDKIEVCHVKHVDNC